MHKTIISDTSCFIILNKIGELDLLFKVYGQITTTPEIANEFGDSLPMWVEIIAVKNKLQQQLLEMQIDKGGSSALALALETPGSTLILDDYKARKIAQQLHLNFTGTVGVIIKAKLNGIILSVRPFIDKISKQISTYLLTLNCKHYLRQMNKYLVLLLLLPVLYRTNY